MLLDEAISILIFLLIGYVLIFWVAPFLVTAGIFSYSAITSFWSTWHFPAPTLAILIWFIGMMVIRYDQWK